MGCGTSKPPPELRRPSPKRRRSHSSSSSSSSCSDVSYNNRGKSNHNTNDKREAKPSLTLAVEPENQKNDENQQQEENSIKTLELIKEPEDNNDKVEETEGANDEDTRDNNKGDAVLIVEPENKPSEDTLDKETSEKNTEGDNTKTPEPGLGETEGANDEDTRIDNTGDTVLIAEPENKPSEDEIDKETSEKNTEGDNITKTPEPGLGEIEKETENPEEKKDTDLSPNINEDAKKTDRIESGKATTIGATAEENMEDNDDGYDDEYDDLYTPFDEEDEEDLEIEGYVQNELGLMIKTTKFLTKHKDEEEDQRPVVKPGELYTDREFPLDIAIVQDSSGVEWKRPGEFLSEPMLFHNDATRFDIGQGSAGTCWFLSTVSTIADNPDMINQVVPKDAYNIENSEAYDGVFHARFYRFGKWEDIYIDDYVPVLYGNVPWGAKSSTNENEVWVCLLEKAFARLHGSYDSIYGGQPGDAYLQLTGGIGERVELDDKGNQDKQLFRRITNALQSGCQVTCVVPDQFDNVKGLVGGHAYSLVGTATVNKTNLVRVRNPWGRGEWKGAWSDESPEFASIQSSSEKVPKKDDGEFYISLDDFMKHFSQTTICSLTPDFDCDGKADPMNFILNLFGEWTDESMGGFQELLKNPRFSFTVTEEGILDDGTVPLVIQMIQHTEKRKAGNASIRCDVFKIKADKVRPTGRTIAAEIQGKKNNVYTTELQSSFRHKLKPGRYMAIPSTCNGDVKKPFLLRVYTPGPLKNCKEVGMDTNILTCENEDSLTHGGHTYDLTFDKTMFGAFVSGVNAGGQVSNRDTYSINPQYLISIPNTGKDVPLIVHVMQTQEEPKYPVGFRLFNLDKGVNPPVSVDYLYDKYNASPVDIEGNSSKFMISWDVDVRYLLPAGRYVALIHMDQPDTEKAFAIVFKSNTNIGLKGLQTGE